MGSIEAENTAKQELDDSGCVQDASVSENGYKGQVQIMDLSDDVLLYILNYCKPRDLKALGHTCARFGELIRDRTLWTRVDARSEPVGLQRFKWILTHCLSSSTSELKLKGYVTRQSRCLGIQDLQWPLDKDIRPADECCAGNPPGIDMNHFLLRMWYPHLPRYAVAPRWPDKKETEANAPKRVRDAREKMQADGQTKIFKVDPDKAPKQLWHSDNTYPPGMSEDIVDSCRGPQFTLNFALLRELNIKCPNLTSLSLERCNIDYKKTTLRQFPPKLKRLSLKGTRCYNIPLNTSFICKIHERLPELEVLDVSDCEWFEPACLMPLSKLPNLRELYMKCCRKLTECVAYASIATRYGFRKLKKVDCRGSPVADSEVSALGWLPCLEELYCSPPSDYMGSSHTHSWNDTLFTFQELDEWEMEVPEYYQALNRPDLEDDVAEAVGDEVEEVPPWYSNDRRIIVIQPNANRMEEPRNMELGELPFDPFGPLRVDPIHPPQGPPRPGFDNIQGPARITRQGPGFHISRNVGTMSLPGVERPDDRDASSPADVDMAESSNASFKSEDSLTINLKKKPEPAKSLPKDGPSTSVVVDQDVNNPTPGSSFNTDSPGPSPNCEPIPGPSPNVQPRPGPSHNCVHMRRPNFEIIPVPNTRNENRSEPVQCPGFYYQPKEGPSANNEYSRECESSPGPSVTLKRSNDNNVIVVKRPRVDSSSQTPPKPQASVKPMIRTEKDKIVVNINTPPPVVPSRPASVNQGASTSRSESSQRNRNQDYPNEPIDVEIPTHYELSPLASENFVTDAAILRFGRADNDNINYVHIGRIGVEDANNLGMRPDRSALRILSVTGYRNITDRSLEHLATAAPLLEVIDFNNTRVTPQGIRIFNAIRSNCKVEWSEFKPKKRFVRYRRRRDV